MECFKILYCVLYKVYVLKERQKGYKCLRALKRKLKTIARRESVMRGRIDRYRPNGLWLHHGCGQKLEIN
jgi:hypothetical protein